MTKTTAMTSSLLIIFISAISIPNAVIAGQLVLAQYPAGSASREPAPNVIVSVDDSGSMGAAGIATLKDALKQTFSASNLPDDQIRLAWQSMNRCNGIPSSSTACANKNSLKQFSGIHRSNFLTWVDTLTANNGTPSHMMVRNAGDYLMRTNLGIDSPWASAPGTTLNPIISCRKSFHIFMTDGGWNSSETTDTSKHIDGDRKTTAYQEINIGTGTTSGNIDGTSFKLGNNLTDYIANSDTTKIYYDKWGFGGTNGLNTLSDLAFYYWATDLQPTIPNELNPLIKKTGDEIFSSTITIPEFWNPKNDPATWQHMVTYTIGFGTGASSWAGSPAWGGDTYSGDYSKLILGTVTWPSPLCSSTETSRNSPYYSSGNSACDGANGYAARDNERRIELWHSAINGRGKFVPAPNAETLVSAFKEIIGTIVTDTSTPITSFTSASSSVTRTGTEQYSSGYAANTWTGYVKSETLAKNTGATSPNSAWGIKTGIAAPNNYVTTADKLDALSETDITNRLILTTNDTTTAGVGVSFEWATTSALLSANQKILLNTDSKGADRVNFLRGNRTKEGSTTALPFRIRSSRQGDIVNSALWYVGTPASNYSFENFRTFAASHKARLPMLYVGGNDGMLHGFSAKDGSEKIAYVPKGVIKNLPTLSSSTYTTHAYYVDGSPFSGDVNLNSTTPDWHTFLVGTLGAGGKGYFVLDITKPGTTATDGTGIATNFSKTNAASLVVMDKTMPKDDATTGDAADIGHIMAAPVVEDSNPQKVSQITRMNNGRWAVVMGNGYNSTNERPVLLIQYLDGLKELKTISAATTGTKSIGNGLSAPRLVDINGDGKPDVAYAGDLQGNMWKFDIADLDANNWGMAFSGLPLYTAVYSSGTSSSVQPITAPPIVKPNDRGAGGLMVAFGTGKNLTEADRTDNSKQTIYSVLDNTRYKISDSKVVIDTSSVTPATIGTGVNNLVEQTVISTTISGSGSSVGRKYWNVSQNNVSYSGPGAKKGWYLHLPEDGERILDAMTFYDGSNNLEIISEVPGSGGSLAEETCTPLVTLPRKYRTFLNIMSGQKPGAQILDVNGDGVYSIVDDQGVSRMEASIKEGRTTNAKTETRKGSDGKEDKFAKMPELSLRPSWRQLQ